MNEARVLVVEDDVTMQRLLRAQLGARGFEVQTVDNGLDAITAVADYEPHLLLMDIGIPGIDGLEVCRQIREWSSLPIILVSALDAPKTKETALELGADDYITKPFYVGELVARIRAVLRRTTASGGAQQSIVHVGDLTVDIMRREIRRGDQPLHVTKTEFDLLREFLCNTDRVLTYQHLLDAVWGTGYDDPRLVHVHVCNLRRKLEARIDGPRHIVALPGVGYRFTIGGSSDESLVGGLREE
jgi:two-component system KDP operon response regulator KdpE